MRRPLLLLILTGTAGLVWLFARPQPLLVDLSVVTRGSMVLTVREDGKTRIREKYTVSSPLAGRLIRIDLDPGDAVVAGETQLAVIQPTNPALLDPRALAEARARVQASTARLARLQPQQDATKEKLKFAETELGRVRQLSEKNAVPPQLLDEKQLAFDLARAEYNEVAFARDIAEYELKLDEAALIHSGEPGESQPEYQFPITAPITGQVLRVFHESATIVTAGSPLLELGDPADLEVEVDVLSSDAVRIRPGTAVFLEQWGGEHPLTGRVRRVEPAAFTKISALGVEEQRVNVIIDFEHQDVRVPLGDGFRVEARIVVWASEDVVKVPAGALFRSGRDWAVYCRVGGRAQLTRLTIGHRNETDAEVLSGLTQGAEVVLYPGDTVREGARLVPLAAE